MGQQKGSSLLYSAVIKDNSNLRSRAYFML